MDEAIRIVLANTEEIAQAEVSLMEVLGRTLAADIRSDLNMQPFDKSAMDGYAVIGSDVTDASATNAVLLTVVEEIPAGTVPRMPVALGQASRITTGAPIPKGADTVVIVEETRMGDDGRVAILEATEPGSNVIPLAEDVQVGQTVLSAGTTVRPPEIGILAAMGAVKVSVLRQPVVGIVATGGEIVEPDCTPDAGQIRNSNGYSMSAQVITAGASPQYLGIVDDRAEALRDTISRGLDCCDIVMLSGGVSAGVFDLVQGAMQDCGVEVLFDRIQMKPGKPLTFGVRGEKLIFGLPGNPVSSVVGFELLVRPCIRKMQRMAPLHLPRVHGRLKQAFGQRPGRKQFVPAWTRREAGGYVAEWVGHHGSADLFSFSRANSLFVIEADVDLQPEGSEVEIAKDVTDREAVAAGEIRMRPETVRLITEGRVPKGNVLETARLAGIMAAKRTSDLIPLCHPLNVTGVEIRFEPGDEGFVAEARVRLPDRTGVEMEALTAVSVCLLTIYDMCKAADRGMVIGNIRLIQKRGGSSGTYTRQEQ